MLKELKALRDRVNQLEQQLKDSQAKAAAAPTPQWGMTPEQAAELNRLTVKTEALEDFARSQRLQGPEDQRPDATRPTSTTSAQDLAGFQFLDIGGQLRLQLLRTPTSAWPSSTSRRKCPTAPSGG